MLKRLLEPFISAMNVVALIIVFVIGAKQLLMPYVAAYIYEDDYKKLVFKCDTVMREHFIAKNRLMVDPTEDSAKIFRAAEVGLVECHDYDVLRKRLGKLGLDENWLALIGLEAIEENAEDVREFVRTHQIKY